MVIRLAGTALPPVEHALHPLHALVLLLLDQEPLDAGLQGAGPLRHIAVEAVQAVGLALEQRFAVLVRDADAEV